MQDTTVLKVTNFKVVDCSKFSPNPEKFLENTWRYVKDKKPYKSTNFYGDLREEKHLIHVCLYLNYYMDKPVLYVTIHSIPKLLFGNNLKEVTQNDFELVISRIQKVLLNDCGVKVSEEDLEKAEVQEVHYSINFHLSEYITANGVMDILSKSKISGLYFDKKLYMEQGGLKFRSIDKRKNKQKRRKPSIEISFYDKRREIRDRQPDVVVLPTSAEILRYEVKLSNLSRIKRFPIGEIFNTPESRQFRNVFNKYYSILVLEGFLKELKKKMPKCIPVDCPLSDQELSIQEIKQNEDNYRVQRRQVKDTILQLLLASNNENFKLKTFEMLIFNYFFNDKKSIKFLTDNNLDIKETNKVLLIKPIYKDIIKNLIGMVNRRNKNV